MKPLLTEDEKKAIRDSLRTNEEKIEYNRWVGYYEALAEALPTFALAFEDYREEVKTLLCFIQQWEDYSNEEMHLNMILTDLRNSGNREGIEILFKNADTFRFEGSKLKTDEEGYFVIDINHGLKTQMNEQVRRVSLKLKTLKEITIGVETWIERKNCKVIAPEQVIQILTKAKDDLAYLIAPPYSTLRLKRMIEEGKTPNDYEKERAIIPNFEDSEFDQEEVDTWIDTLERLSKN